MPGIPSAKALYLCEEVDVEGDSFNLYALLDALRPRQYPHVEPSFVCFAQLRGGLGTVRCHIDVRNANTYQLVYNTNVYLVHFTDRSVLRQLAITIEGCKFALHGVYLVELYCDNAWVADTVLLLREAQT